MKLSLFLGPLELALHALPGPLETLLAARYAPWLGAVRDPDARIRLDESRRALRGERTVAIEGGTCRISLPGGRGTLESGGVGEFELRPDVAAVDQLLLVLCSVLMPRAGGVLVRALTVLGPEAGHVVFGPVRDVAARAEAAGLPVLGEATAVVHRRDRWVVVATPLGQRRPVGLDEAPLAALWEVGASGGAAVVPFDRVDAVRLLLERAVLPTTDRVFRAGLFDTAAAVAAGVPAGGLDAADPEALRHLDANARALDARRAILRWDPPKLSRRTIDHDVVLHGRQGARP